MATFLRRPHEAVDYEAIERMFPHRPSTSRPHGSIRPR